MPKFKETRAYGRLAQLAQNPPDLTDRRFLTPARVQSLRTEGCGFCLIYGTQRVDGPILEALSGLAQEMDVVARLKGAMEGERINRIEGYDSEDRQVLHFAARDQFSDLPGPGSAEEKKQAAHQLEELKGFLAKLDHGQLTGSQGQPFTDLVNIGIGGSDLGPKAIHAALAAYSLPNRRTHYVSNVDPDDLARVLGTLDLSRTLVNVVSKSGATLETLTNETLARHQFKQAGLKPERHFVCVTGEGSPMDDASHYLEAFHMFDYIGGRYSATSMVGGVSLGFSLGYHGFEQILRGARRADLAALEPDPLKNVPLLMALLGLWNRNFLGHPTVAILPYSQALERFRSHLQQLDMESNGKRITRLGQEVDFETGPIIWGEPGTNGQHAFFQLIHQSPTVVPCEFIGFRQSQRGLDMEVQKSSSQQKLVANLLAQIQALAMGKASDNPNRHFPGNRPSLLLMADRLTPEAMGTLLSFYENKVAFQGLLWNINSFDQEGVQLGKLLATRMLEHMRQAQPGMAPPTDDDDSVGWALLQAAKMI